MCGIVGYIGSRPAVEVLLAGLSRLEYRGYDSAGIATVNGGQLHLERAAGKLNRLRQKLGGREMLGSQGIGHTRWATHGRPTDENAHPHEADGVVVVHNGIIENYVALKGRLLERGRKFKSETDTEVLAHLCAEHLRSGKDFVQAVRATLNEVTGAYAALFMSASDPEHLVAAKVASPMVVGLGDGEGFVASDIPALLPYTRRVMVLEEGDFAVLERGEVTVTTLAGDAVVRHVRHIDWSTVAAEKAGYPHFMLKEIHEQPQAVADSLRGRISLELGTVELEEPEFLKRSIERVVIVAMGTSFHAGMLLKYYIEKIARLPVALELASEFRYRDPLLGPNTLAVAISQSGETADTLAAAKEAKQRGAVLLSICNVMDSSLARLGDTRLYTRAGLEIGVASTKAYTTQLAVGYLLALALAARGSAQDPTRQAQKPMLERVRALAHMPKLMSEVLTSSETLVSVAKTLLSAQGAFFLGRGPELATAYEGALKLKELAYIHAQGYAAGEMKHGPIALIDEHLPVIVVGPHSATHEKLLSSVEEVRARGGKVLAICTAGDEALPALADFSFRLPPCDPELAPLLSVLPLQFLAYHIARLRGNDVDQPRNLAKSVTVE